MSLIWPLPKQINLVRIDSPEGSEYDLFMAVPNGVVPTIGVAMVENVVAAAHEKYEDEPAERIGCIIAELENQGFVVCNVESCTGEQ